MNNAAQSSGRDFGLLPDAGAKPTKKNLAIMERFDRAVWVMLEGHKATCVYTYVPEGVRDVDNREHRRYELPTKAGTLVVSPYGNWVACRFLDETRDVLATLPSCGEMNPYSGKWNHNYFLSNFDSALADVKRWLEYVCKGTWPNAGTVQPVEGF